MGYLDADWAGDLDECKLTSGYVFLPNNGAISWNNMKQTCIALSTIEVKFVACTTVVQEAIYLKRFLESLGILRKASCPVTMLSDNQATLAYLKDPKYHGTHRYQE